MLFRSLSATVSTIQAVRSDEAVLVQFADVLTGAASAKLNGTLHPGTAKTQLVASLERGLGRGIGPTPKGERKFNVFEIHPGGGW